MAGTEFCIDELYAPETVASGDAKAQIQRTRIFANVTHHTPRMKWMKCSSPNLDAHRIPESDAYAAAVQPRAGRRPGVAVAEMLLNFWFTPERASEPDRLHDIWFQAIVEFDAALTEHFSADCDRPAAGVYEPCRAAPRRTLAWV
jgi:hypothetical protein